MARILTAVVRKGHVLGDSDLLVLELTPKNPFAEERMIESRKVGILHSDEMIESREITVTYHKSNLPVSTAV
jgi:hypothetical protein